MCLPKKVNIENTLIKYKSPTQRITTIIFSNIFNNLLFILCSISSNILPRNKDLSACGDSRLF